MYPLAGDVSGARRPQQEPTEVTAANLDSYGMTDVVMPLPGHGVTLPQHDVIRGWYTELLAEDDVTMETFNHRVRYVGTRDWPC